MVFDVQFKFVQKFVSYRRLIYLFFSIYFETVLKKRVKEDRKWEKWKLKWEFLLIWKFRRNLNPVVNLNHLWLNRVKCAEFSIANPNQLNVFMRISQIFGWNSVLFDLKLNIYEYYKGEVNIAFWLFCNSDTIV